MDDAQVRGGRRVEQLGDLVVGMGVGVVATVRVLVRQLLGERRELAGRLLRERVPALDGGDRERAVVRPAEPDRAVGGQRLVVAVAAGQHHVDDGVQFGIEQDLEGGIRRIPVLVGDFVHLVHDGRGYFPLQADCLQL